MDRELALTPKAYSRGELIALGNMAKINQRFKIINHAAVSKIQRFRLNRRGKQGGHRASEAQQSINLNNLKQINTTTLISRMDKKLSIATLNVQSLKNKSNQIFTDLHTDNIDIVLLTETWLTDSDEETQGLADLGLKIETNNRKDRRGGGIALVCKSRYSIQKHKKLNKTSFQASCWTVKVGNLIVNVLGIYHPPYGSDKNNTQGVFLDEFTDLITGILPDHQNIVLLGDLNLHLNRYEQEYDVQIFMDTLEALGIII